MPRSLVFADCCVCVCACVVIDVYVFSRLIAWACLLQDRNTLLCCVCILVSNQSFESFIPLSSRPWRDYSFFGVESVREAVRDTLIHNCRVKAQEVILESCKRVCLGLLIICLFTCHYHSKSVLAEEILLHLIAHGINLKHPDDFFTVRVYQEINLILTNLNLMGSSSENRNKEQVDPLHNVAAGVSFFLFFHEDLCLILYFH